MFIADFNKLDDKDLEGKLKFSTPPILIKKEENDLFKRFLYKYKDEIDKLLAFLFYAFSNIENLKEEYEKIKPLLKENNYSIKFVLTKKEKENIEKFLNNELEKIDFIFKLKKIEEKNKNEGFFLFSLDIIEFNEETENLEKEDFHFNLMKDKPVNNKLNDFSLKDLLNLEIQVEVEEESFV